MPCALPIRSEEHTSGLQSPCNLVCRVLFRSDRKSTRLNSSHLVISYAVFCLKKTSDIARPRASLAADPRDSQAGARNTTSIGPSRFFFNDAATTEIYALSLHDALPI